MIVHGGGAREHVVPPHFLGQHAPYQFARDEDLGTSGRESRTTPTGPLSHPLAASLRGAAARIHPYVLRHRLWRHCGLFSSSNFLALASEFSWDQPT
jgi:hypothetical protein